MRPLLTRDRIVLVSLFLLGTTIYFTMPNSNGHSGGVAELDGYYYYIYLRSLQVDGNLDFSNEYEEWGNPFSFGKAETGYARNIFGAGPALLWAPFFLLAHLLALIGIKLGFPLSLDGMSRFHQILTFYGSLVYGWLAVVFCYRLAKEIFGKDHALWATLGAALAGPLPYYACFSWSSYSHAQAAMAASLLVWLWIRWRLSWTLRRWVLWGAAAGLVLLIRPADCAFMLLPLFEAIRAIVPSFKERDWRRLRFALLPPLAGGLAALVVFSPQIVVWKILLGRWFIIPQGEGFMLWSDPAWYSTLFSPRNGLFTVAPLMAVAVLGLIVGVRRRSSLGAPLCLILIGMLIINGAVYDWWGWGFSARRFTSALPLFTFGLAVALQAARERLARNPPRTAAWITGLIVLLAILFNLQWMVNFGLYNMDWYSIRSTEGLYMTVTHSLFGQVYSTVGNPMSLPSSLVFKLRRGGSPRVFDQIDGSYLLGEFHPGANPAGDPYLHATFDFGDLRFRPFLSDSFGFPVRGKDGIRYVSLREESGYVFLPINRPGALHLTIGGRARLPDTRVEFFFNGHTVGTHTLPTRQWSAIDLSISSRLVERGINRLDLIHRIPPSPRIRQCLAGVCTEVDLAAVSGGLLAGNFGEVWLEGHRVTSSARGLNVVVADPSTGRLLGQRSFDVFLYPGLYRELTSYLSLFPRGSLVAVAMRGEGGRFFSHGGKEAFALFGAWGEACKEKNVGYAALGVLGADIGTALEKNAGVDHARVHLGRPPPPWRELAYYRAIRLR